MLSILERSLSRFIYKLVYLGLSVCRLPLEINALEQVIYELENMLEIEVLPKIYVKRNIFLHVMEYHKNCLLPLQLFLVS